MDGVLDNPLAAGRDALRRHAWHEAVEFFSELDKSGALPGDGLAMLAEASWWRDSPK